MKIHCVIPVYNTQRYLRQCIDSVLRQTYHNFDIILVNDASTDKSRDICLSYQNKYPEKIHFIDKVQNEGVDKARFTGLRFLTENYNSGGVFFLDSDDYIHKNTFKILAYDMQTTDADVVQMLWCRVFGPVIKRGTVRVMPQVLSQPSLMNDYYISFFGVNKLDVNIWGKLYKLETIIRANLNPSGFKMGEDLIFNLSLFPFIKKYSIIDFYGYYYRVGGLTSGYNKHLWPDLKQQYFIKKAESKKHGLAAAEKYLSIEIKNIFLSVVKQRIIHLNEPAEKLNAWITSELRDKSIWSNFRELSAGNDVYNYFINEDSDSIIQLVRQNIRDERCRRFVKRILSCFLR